MPRGFNCGRSMLNLDIDEELIVHAIKYPDFMSIGHDNYEMYIKYFEGYILGVVIRKYISGMYDVMAAHWILYPSSIHILH